MKKDSDLRITIIGLGNLMDVLFPCIAETVRRENIAEQVNATTADMENLKPRRKNIGIRIILNENLKALTEMEPDIIFFAPPPKVAPGVIKGELQQYFEYIRKKAGSIPDIYAFPPVPQGPFYSETLGDDVRIVNLIPHPVRTIDGKPLKGEGFYTRTFHGDWPEERKALLKRIFSAFGEGVELKASSIIPMLGGVIMLTVLSELVLTVTDALSGMGQSYDHRVIALYLRGRTQEAFKFRPPESEPCPTDNLQGPLAKALDATILAWHEGLREYYREVGFSTQLTNDIMIPDMDFQLHILHGEPREIIERNIVVGATKGGVLEKGVKCYHERIKPLIQTCFRGLPNLPDDGWR